MSLSKSSSIYARSLNKRSIVYYLTELFRLLDMRPLLRVAFIANAHSKMGKGVY